MTDIRRHYANIDDLSVRANERLQLEREAGIACFKRGGRDDRIVPELAWIAKFENRLPDGALSGSHGHGVSIHLAPASLLDPIQSRLSQAVDCGLDVLVGKPRVAVRERCLQTLDLKGERSIGEVGLTLVYLFAR